MSRIESWWRIAAVTLCLLAPFTSAIAVETDCDALRQAYQDKQSEILAAEAALDFEEQFELVQRTLDEIEEAMSGSADDADAVAEKIGQLLDLTRTSHEGIRDAAGQIQDALGKLSGAAGAVNDAIDQIQTATGYLDKINNASKASPREALQIFGEYFGDISSAVEPLVDRIPALGAFLTIYARAIESAAAIAGQLDDEVRRRDRLMREFGPDGAGDLYVHGLTPRQRIEAHKRELYRQLEELAERLEDECGERAEPDEDPLERARDLARRACQGAAREVLADEYQSAHRDWRRANRSLNETQQALRDNRRSMQTVQDKVDWERQQIADDQDLVDQIRTEEIPAIQRRLNDLEPPGARHARELLERHLAERTAAAERVAARSRAAQNRLSALERMLRERRQRHDELAEQIQHQADQLAEATRSRDRSACALTACERDWLENEARAKGWDLGTVRERFASLYDTDCDEQDQDEPLGQLEMSMPETIRVTWKDPLRTAEVARQASLTGGVQHVADSIEARPTGGQVHSIEIPVAPRLTRNPDGSFDLSLEVGEPAPTEAGSSSSGPSASDGRRAAGALEDWSFTLTAEQVARLKHGEMIFIPVKEYLDPRDSLRGNPAGISLRLP